MAASSADSDGADPAGAGLRKYGRKPEDGISSASRPRSSPAAASRGRTCRIQDRCAGETEPASSRTLVTTCHIGETANRVWARSLAENGSSATGSLFGFTHVLISGGHFNAARIMPA